MSRVDYEYPFDPEAVNNTATSVYRLAAGGGSRVLDLGSGPGIVSSHLQANASKLVTCLDSDPALLAVAAERGVGRTIVADLNEDGWVDELGGESFDVVILADVLEHLYNPGRTLQLISNSGLLRDDGYLVVSIPNASHEGALAELISGQLTYRPTGLLDETHIRFFTLASFQRLAEANGFFIAQTERTIRRIEQTEFKSRLSDIPPELRSLVNEHSPESRVYQYVFRLMPGTELGALAMKNQELDDLKEALVAKGLEVEALKREEIESLNAAVAEQRAQSKALEGQVTQLKALKSQQETRLAIAERALSEGRESLRRLREGQIRRLLKLDRAKGELEQRLKSQHRERKQLEKEIHGLERRIELIYDSNTWRVGDRIRRAVALFRPKPQKIREPEHPLTKQETAHEVSESALQPHTSPLASEYEDELNQGVEDGATGIGFAVSTRDFNEGRGDLFVASGLGRRLRKAGWSPIYLPPNVWYDVPSHLDTLVVMLPAFRPTKAPAGVRVVGWIRNEVEKWVSHTELELFDALLCSSSLVAAEIERHYQGPVATLPIGVDIELFIQGESKRRLGVVSTVNQWGRERDVYRALRSSDIDFPLSIYGQKIGLASELHKFHKGSADFFALPSVYRSASVVLDDFNHTTVGWGAVNSRIFESLASGALPVTNSALGLDELGLSEVPTYHDPRELNSLVENLLSHHEETTALTNRLADVVRTRHSYEQRAKDMIALLERKAESAQRVIAFFPDYRNNNPFQDMLYSERKKHDTVVFPLQELKGLDTSLSRFGDRDRILHLHWTAPIIGRSETESDALIRVHEAINAIDRFREKGGRLVWTVHNVMPHETHFADIEIHLRSELADRADFIHVMCEETLDETRDLYELSSEKTRVVEHSSYIDVYPDSVSRETARSRLAIEADDIVLLAFGGIRPYKGIDRLLAAFDRALDREPRLRLVVAGKPGRFEGINDLRQALDEHPRCIAVFSEINPSDVQFFFKAADVAVLAHKTVLNSGALLLAYTFGLPVIAPRFGCLTDLVDSGPAITFDHQVEGALEDALISASGHAHPEARRAARRAAEERPVAKMSDLFFEELQRSRARVGRP